MAYRKRRAEYSIQQDLSKKSKDIHMSDRRGYNIADGQKYQNQIKKNIADLIEVWMLAISGDNLQSEELAYHAIARKLQEAMPAISSGFCKQILKSLVELSRDEQTSDQMKRVLQHRHILVTQININIFE
jgi:hypothetical protein